MRRGAVNCSGSERMVKEQIVARGIRDEKVLKAMRKVDRRRFVSGKERERAYGDHPICIGNGQTISQPYVVAFMTSALELSTEDRVLEIGTGCGYQTAVLAEIASEVSTIEIVEELGLRARRQLNQIGYTNVEFNIGDGGKGWPEARLFDKIMVTAAPVEVPDALLEQLKPDGILVIPVGGADQHLLRFRRVGEGIEREQLLQVRFVPMTGCVAS